MEREEQFLDLVGRSLSGNSTAAEEQQLAALLDQDPLLAEQYRQIHQNWLEAEDFGKDFNPSAADAWQKVKVRLVPAQEVITPAAVVTPLFSYLKYAASILLFCTAAFFAYRSFRDPVITVETAKGERRELTLPDHSRIWLNELSRIEYAENFNTKEKRLVKLQGEAFFKVTKNPLKRFVVEAGDTKTQVFGTSFNVKAIKNEGLQVALLEGKVSFSDLKDHWTEALKPGELAYLDSDGKHGKRPFTDVNFLFWKNHELRFTDQKLEDILAVIGKNYHVQFDITDPALAKQQITTSIKGDSVQQVINVLEVLLDVRVVKKQNSYQLQSKK